METLLQDPIILGCFQNNTLLPLKLIIQSDNEIPLVPGEISQRQPIVLSGLMTMELNILDGENNPISDPILIWNATSTTTPIMYQQASRYGKWELVPTKGDGIGVYHFNLHTEGDSLVIIGTVELEEEDALQEKAHA